MYIYLKKDANEIIVRTEDDYSVLFHPNKGASYTVSKEAVEDELAKLINAGYINITNKHYAHFINEEDDEIILVDESDYSNQFLILRKKGANGSLPRSQWDNKYATLISEGYKDVSSIDDKVYQHESRQQREESAKYPFLDSVYRMPYSELDLLDRVLNNKGFDDVFTRNKGGRSR